MARPLVVDMIRVGEQTGELADALRLVRVDIVCVTSDHEDLAVWLMEQGINSVSLNPDTVVQTWLDLAKR